MLAARREAARAQKIAKSALGVKRGGGGSNGG